MTHALLRLAATSVILAASSTGPTGAQRETRRLPTDGAVIRGRIVAADTKQPIRDAMVGVVPVDRPPTVKSWPDQAAERAVLVDPDGRFELAGVAPGKYRVLATPGPSSLRYLRALFPDPASESPQPLMVSANQVLDDVEIRLTRAGVIAGRIMTERGEPFGLVAVTVFEALPGQRQRLVESGWLTGIRTTDDTGSFRIFGLAPGSYYLLAQPVRRSPISPVTITNEYASTYYPGTHSIEEAAAIRVQQGEEHTGLEFVVHRSPRLFTVRGVVLDADGNPAPGVQIRVDPGSAARATAAAGPARMGGPLPIGVFVNVASDHSGMFSVSGLHAGENALSISRYSGRGAEYAWVPLTIAGDINDLTIRLQPGFTITGHITFEKAAPAAHATLQISSIPARLVGAIRSASVQANPDGSFALEHQFGPTLLRAGGLRGWHLKSVQYAGRDVIDQPTEFATGTDVEIILTQRAATVSGTVTTRNGALTDAAVMLISDNPTLWNERATTSKLTNAAGDGKYRIEGLRAGRYLAVALPKDEASLTDTTPAFFALLAKHGTPVSLDEGEPKVLDLKIVSLR